MIIVVFGSLHFVKSSWNSLHAPSNALKMQLCIVFIDRCPHNPQSQTSALVPELEAMSATLFFFIFFFSGLLSLPWRSRFFLTLCMVYLILYEFSWFFSAMSLQCVRHKDGTGLSPLVVSLSSSTREPMFWLTTRVWASVSKILLLLLYFVCWCTFLMLDNLFIHFNVFGYPKAQHGALYRSRYKDHCLKRKRIN